MAPFVPLSEGFGEDALVSRVSRDYWRLRFVVFAATDRIAWRRREKRVRRVAIVAACRSDEPAGWGG
jgi:hypothetical protein